MQALLDCWREANFSYFMRLWKSLKLNPWFWSGLFFFALFNQGAWCDSGNYNSVLLGERAAGMGGAFTAMTGDPAACSYYNPATLALMEGTSFSASANLYNKYDTSFSNAGNLSDSTLKLNRGSFQGIPSSAGSANAFGTFAVGISIITPDYDIFNGDISLNSDPNATSFVNYKDQSLWVGGNLAINFTPDLSAGITVYYTSRDFQRATADQTVVGSTTKFTYEEKVFTSNNVVYILGSYYRISPRFALGLSMRLPSIQLSGDGSYFHSVLDTSVSGKTTITSQKNIASLTHIPMKLAAGIAYEVPKVIAIAFDVTGYGADSYRDLADPNAGDQISFRQVINYSLGAEYYLRNWLALRSGVFTNFSSHEEITDVPQRQGDHIDMLGFSANVGFFTGKTSISLGGYFTGGRGESTQEVGQKIVVTPKVQYIYSFLVASSYHF